MADYQTSPRSSSLSRGSTFPVSTSRVSCVHLIVELTTGRPPPCTCDRPVAPRLFARERPCRAPKVSGVRTADRVYRSCLTDHCTDSSGRWPRHRTARLPSLPREPSSHPSTSSRSPSSADFELPLSGVVSSSPKRLSIACFRSRHVDITLRDVT